MEDIIEISEKKKKTKISGTGKGFSIRIYPDKKQIEYIRDSFRVNNFIYNYFLSKQEKIVSELKEMGLEGKALKSHMKLNNLYFDYNSSRDLLYEMKKTPEYSFLGNASALSYHYALMRLKNAFDNMWKMNTGFPNYRKRHINKSFSGQILFNTKADKYSPFEIQTINDKWCEITLTKITELKCVVHNNELLDFWNDRSYMHLKSYTITETPSGEFYLAITADIISKPMLEKRIVNEETSIGIDMGVARPITTSDEELFNDKQLSDKFNLIKEYKSEVERLSQILAKKREGNKNWKESKKYERIKKRLAKLHSKIANIRKYLQHNITSKLINSKYDTIIIEDLDVKNMMKKSAKGKSNNKRGLNRVLSDTGLGEIKRQLVYKSNWCGKNIVTVDPKYTSQMCSNCGHTHRDNRKKQDEFICVSCGHNENADLNAAKNIKNKFFKKLAELKN